MIDRYEVSIRWESEAIIPNKECQPDHHMRVLLTRLMRSRVTLGLEQGCFKL